MDTLFFAAAVMKEKFPLGARREEPAYAGPRAGLVDGVRVSAVLGGMLLYAGLLGAFLR